MAKEMVVVYTDDLTGERLPESGGQTVTFGIDGTTYEIDLSHDNAKDMREELRRYTEHARRVGLGTSPRRRRDGVPQQYREAAIIRQWAVERGLLKPGSRGRIPHEVREKYHNRTTIERVDDAHRAHVASPAFTG